MVSVVTKVAPPNKLACVGREGFAISVEGEAGSELVGNELEVWKPLERQEGGKEALDLHRPSLMVIAA